MPKYTKNDVLRFAKEYNVKYIRLQFTDMLGSIKAVEIPASKLEEALDNKIMFDGSSIEGFVRIKESDMYLRPDPDTWMLMDFESTIYGRTGRMICDVYTSYGKPFPGDPRYCLKRMIKKFNDAGITTCNVGFEPEFYLFKIGPDGEPILNGIDKGSYFDLSPIDGAEYVRKDISLELEKLGFNVQTAHHEVGPGQNEINFRYADVVTACDNVQTFKQVVKVVARKHGYVASFMPKPVAAQAGSGMHTNCSLADLEGKNLFYDDSDPMKLSLICKKWMTGILLHARSITALTNPCVNSYKRLVPGYEAPCYACWSDANRSSLIRIPAIRGGSTRTEIRSVDAMANPYLALSVIMGAGLEGIQKVKDDELIPPQTDNIFSLTREEREAKGIFNVPENLKDAIKEMKADPLIRETLGDHIFDKYVTAKELEWDDYRTLVTTWELNKYLE